MIREKFANTFEKIFVNKEALAQLFRYGLVGIGINAALYLVYLFLVHCGLDPKAAMSIAYILGIAIGYFGHKQLTFANKENYCPTLIRYALAHLGGYLINLVLLWMLVDYFSWPHAFVQVLCIFVVAAYLFLIFKYWVFSEKNYADN